MSENEDQENNTNSGSSYQGLFVMGIIFIGVGAALMVTNPAMMSLMIVGIVFMVIGLGNRGKWQST